MAIPPHVLAKALASIGSRPFGELTWRQAYERGLVDEVELLRVYVDAIDPRRIADAVIQREGWRL